jgi:hypothetical protein
LRLDARFPWLAGACSRHPQRKLPLGRSQSAAREK